MYLYQIYWLAVLEKKEREKKPACIIRFFFCISKLTSFFSMFSILSIRISLETSQFCSETCRQCCYFSNIEHFRLRRIHYSFFSANQIFFYQIVSKRALVYELLLILILFLIIYTVDLLESVVHVRGSIFVISWVLITISIYYMY